MVFDPEYAASIVNAVVTLIFVGYPITGGERATRQTLRSKERRMSVGQEWKT